MQAALFEKNYRAALARAFWEKKRAMGPVDPATGAVLERVEVYNGSTSTYEYAGPYENTFELARLDTDMMTLSLACTGVPARIAASIHGAVLAAGAEHHPVLRGMRVKALETPIRDAVLLKTPGGTILVKRVTIQLDTGRVEASPEIRVREMWFRPGRQRTGFSGATAYARLPCGAVAALLDGKYYLCSPAERLCYEKTLDKIEVYAERCWILRGARPEERKRIEEALVFLNMLT